MYVTYIYITLHLCFIFFIILFYSFYVHIPSYLYGIYIFLFVFVQDICNTIGDTNTTFIHIYPHPQPIPSETYFFHLPFSIKLIFISLCHRAVLVLEGGMRSLPM